MPQPFQAQPRLISRRALLGGLAATAGLVGGGLLWRRRPLRWRSGFTLQLLPSEPSDPGLNLLGLQWVVRAHLTALAPAFVVASSREENQLPLRRRAFQLQLRPNRQGNLLAPGFRWRRPGLPWNEVIGRPEEPAQAVATLLAALPEFFEPDPQGNLLPQTSELAWELINLAPARRPLSEVPGLRGQLENLVAKAPNCALAWCLFGTAAYQEILSKSDWIPEDRALAETCFKRAMDIVPGLPSAAGEMAQMLSDFGENGAAMAVLAQALRVHPHSEFLLRRLAYSARNAGLLEVAKAAVLKREAWMGRLEGIENALLYLGDFRQFEEGITNQVQNDGWSPSLRFYLGYSALLRGDREEALRRLREAGGQWSDTRFGSMGYVLWTWLEGRMEDSLEALEKLVLQHFTLRTPDGEFIFKLAELMALHGKTHRALDLATRAAAHGFGCVHWYERNPFLAPIRGFLRFQAMLHTLRDRQAAQAENFPPSAFGL
ncbi:MAG: hypothetical protein IPN59_08770 [Holophaga sp.]|nr:hypothetical protein [Holophaga sp.]